MFFWSSCGGSVVKNSTSIHEDAGSIPDLTHCVKYLVMQQAAALVADVACIWHFCGRDLGYSCSSNSTPSQGTSYASGVALKETNKIENARQERENKE